MARGFIEGWSTGKQLGAQDRMMDLREREAALQEELTRLRIAQERQQAAREQKENEFRDAMEGAGRAPPMTVAQAAARQPADVVPTQDGRYAVRDAAAAKMIAEQDAAVREMGGEATPLPPAAMLQKAAASPQPAAPVAPAAAGGVVPPAPPGQVGRPLPPSGIVARPLDATETPPAPAQQPAPMPAAPVAPPQGPAPQAAPVAPAAAAPGAPDGQPQTFDQQVAGANAALPKAAPETQSSVLQRQIDVALRFGRTDIVDKLAAQYGRVRDSGLQKVFSSLATDGSDAAATAAIQQYAPGAKVQVTRRYTLQTPGADPIPTTDIQVTHADGKVESVANTSAVQLKIGEMGMELARRGYDVGRQKAQDARQEHRENRADAREERMARAQEQSMRVQAAAAARAASSAATTQRMAAERWSYEKQILDMQIGQAKEAAAVARSGGVKVTDEDSTKVYNQLRSWTERDFPEPKGDSLGGDTKDAQAGIDALRKRRKAVEDAAYGDWLLSQRPGQPRATLKAAYEARMRASEDPASVKIKALPMLDADGTPVLEVDGTPRMSGMGQSYVMVNGQPTLLGLPTQIKGKFSDGSDGPPVTASNPYAPQVAGPPEPLQRGNVPRVAAGTRAGEMLRQAGAPKAGEVFSEMGRANRLRDAAREEARRQSQTAGSR